jgi:hypothetical protein
MGFVFTLACASDEQEAGGDDGSSSGIVITATDTNGEKLDVGDGSTATAGNSGGDCPGGGSGGENTFSVIWIANSPEGTVSKIDTQSATELARYRTGPSSDSDPSRTSVNLQGDVAVANRSGSVTKIASEVERCLDQDGDGTITTSRGPDDMLPWGEDECVLWHHETGFASNSNSNEGGPRAIAWNAGADGNPCVPQADVWIGWRDQPESRVIVRLLDGQTGTSVGETTITDWEGNWGHGTYGGAADVEGAFWGLGTLGTLVQVDPITFDVRRWDNPVSHVMYGIALDARGDPWLAGHSGNLWWFDRTQEAFVDMGDSAGGPKRLRGLTVDTQGHAWAAGNGPCGLVRFDTIGKVLVDGNIPLPGCNEPVGVSIDVDGMVWVVDRGADVAFKVDPDDYDVQIVSGLVSPYTYSDMTGAGLGLVVFPPPG